MKKLYITSICILFTCSLANLAANKIELSVSGAHHARMPIAIIVLDTAQSELNAIAQIIKKDLRSCEQFEPTVSRHDIHLPKKELRKIIKQFCMSGIPLALCISSTSPRIIEWRMYETASCTMLQGKKYAQTGSIPRAWGHAIADQVATTLTNSSGFFTSRLTYCKDSKNDNGNTIRKVYISDFDGSNEELIVDLPTITIAPRWHPHKPQLFYSEYTDTNVRLMSVSMNKKRKIVSNLDGVNMLASFSPDKKSTAYCASRGNGSCQIYLLQNDSLKQCTNNSGNNVSPIFISNDHICFCSDFQTGSPQLYIANIQTNHLQRITHGGYCTSPSYYAQTNKIAYLKMVHGIMQVMLYDRTTKTHSQLTKTNGNKHEVSWSPDGQWLLFAHEIPVKNSRICSLNLTTNKVKYLTKVDDHCSYPHWSPSYEIFPATR